MAFGTSRPFADRLLRLLESRLFLMRLRVVVCLLLVAWRLLRSVAERREPPKLPHDARPDRVGTRAASACDGRRRSPRWPARADAEPVAVAVATVGACGWRRRSSAASKLANPKCGEDGCEGGGATGWVLREAGTRGGEKKNRFWAQKIPQGLIFMQSLPPPSDLTGGSNVRGKMCPI